MTKEIFGPGLMGMLLDSDHVGANSEPLYTSTVVEVMKDFAEGMEVSDERLGQFRVMVKVQDGPILNVRRRDIALFRGAGI